MPARVAVKIWDFLFSTSLSLYKTIIGVKRYLKNITKFFQITMIKNHKRDAQNVFVSRMAIHLVKYFSSYQAVLQFDGAIP